MSTEIAFRQDNHFLSGDIILLQGFSYDLFRSAVGVHVGLDTSSATRSREIEGNVLR